MTSRRASLVLPLLAALLSACHESSRSPSFLPTGVTALGFAADEVTLADGVLIAPEFEAEDDRNGDGDGDGEDTVLHVLDLASGRSTLVPDVEHVSGGGAGFVAFTVPEDRAGRDLNEDGDLLDAVLHVVDARSGTLENVGLAGDRLASPVQAGKWIAFGVPESDQGGIDLDGDGVAASEIVHVHDARRRITSSLEIQIEINSDAIDVRGSWLVASSDEDGGDLNGDGDEADTVVFTHDLVRGTTENLGHAVDAVLAFDGRVLATLVNEVEDSRDLNGDGDAGDQLVEFVALETGARHLLPPGIFAEAGGGLAFLQLEGSSLLYDEFTEEFLELDALPLRDGPRLVDRHAAFVVEELVAGDANHDGDTDDGVLFVFDSRTSTMTNTGTAVAGLFDAGILGAFDLDGERSVYLYSAALDRDEGDWPDMVARIRAHRSGAERDLAPADQFILQDGLVVLCVPEGRLGEDRNGDLDENDTVLQVHDPARGSTFDTGLAVFNRLAVEDGLPKDLDVDGRHLVVRVPEFLTSEDANGDGDVSDWMVFVVRVP